MAIRTPDRISRIVRTRIQHLVGVLERRAEEHYRDT
jgi:hypothetical protein